MWPKLSPELYMEQITRIYKIIPGTPYFLQNMQGDAAESLPQVYPM